MVLPLENFDENSTFKEKYKSIKTQMEERRLNANKNQNDLLDTQTSAANKLDDINPFADALLAKLKQRKNKP